MTFPASTLHSKVTAVAQHRMVACERTHSENVASVSQLSAVENGAEFQYSPQIRKELVSCFKCLAAPLSMCIYDVVEATDKYRADFERSNLERQLYSRRQFSVLAAYLTLYFQSGDVAYRHLYVGELLKIVHDPKLGVLEQQTIRESISLAIRDRIVEITKTTLRPPVWRHLVSELTVMHADVARPAENKLEILCVGDCYMLDVMTFLASPCRHDGIELNPTFVGSYNPIELRKTLRSYPKNAFQLVFYSPFSYTFTSAMVASQGSMRLWVDVDRIRKILDPGLDEVEKNLQLILTHFDCPLLVHNTINLRRHNSKLIDLVKSTISRAERHAVRRDANWALQKMVNGLAANISPNISVLDECHLLDRFSEWHLGRRFVDSEVQHPTVLSRQVAELYRRYITVHTSFKSKKLIVCDLDNTLWDGEIGEGAVKHFHDRQHTIGQLRRKGILLAINSKNDPKNVSWHGSSLSAEDFVASQINWDSKVENIRRIQMQLNLKTKDFVFIDDRADQRQLVTTAFPEIEVLDATAPQVWQALELWSHWLPEQDGLDRTLLYRQREQREGFVADEPESQTMLEQLELKATLRIASAAELKRVAELINRTNQFNLTGSRTTLAELRDWISKPGQRVIIADGADKFGPMGTVCVALVCQSTALIQIPIFVLSCRVFGYGFETAMLNAIKELARTSHPHTADTTPRVVGDYRETDLNSPCRSMYPNHGFTWGDGKWICEVTEPSVSNTWCQVLNLI